MRGRQLINKYLEQGLTPEERFELEKIALTDDFVGEAWEGLHIGDRKDHAAAIQRLRTNITAEKSTKTDAKVVPLYRKPWVYAVAASMLLLTVATFALRQENATPMQGNIAVEDLGKVAADETVALEWKEEENPIEKTIVAPQTNEPPTPATTISKVKNTDTHIPTTTKSTRQPAASEGDNDSGISSRQAPSSSSAMTTINPQTDVLLDADKKEEIVKSFDAVVEVPEVTMAENVAIEPDIVVKNSGPLGSQPPSTTQAEVILSQEVSDEAAVRNKGLKQGYKKQAKMRSEATAESADMSDMIMAHKVISRATPLIGYEELEARFDEIRDLLSAEGFIRGIQKGETLSVITFDLSEGTAGTPINIVMTTFEDGQAFDAIKKVILESGEWSNPSGERVSYEVKM